MIHLGDITKIDGYKVPITDVVVGGSPCQDLSVAGLRKGMQHSALGDGETTRSGLFMEQIRLVKEMRDADRRARGTDVDIRPRYMLWENVFGAFSSNKGEDFRVVLEEVARVAEEGVNIPRPEKGKWANSGVILGDHYSIAWRVFDAQYWGVPQRRRRICLVADFNGHSAAEIVFNEDKQHRATDRRKRNASVTDIGTESRSEVQPESESLSGNPEQSNETWKEASSDVRRSSETSYRAFTYQDREGKPGGGKGGLIQEDLATSLRTNNYMTVFQPVEDLVMYQREFGGKVTENPETSPTLEAAMGMGGNNQPIISYAVDMGGGEPAVVFENHAQDGRFNGPLNVSQPISHTFGAGGNNVPLVVSFDRETFNTGQNFAQNLGIYEDGIQPTLVARGPGGYATKS